VHFWNQRQTTVFIHVISQISITVFKNSNFQFWTFIIKLLLLKELFDVKKYRSQPELILGSSVCFWGLLSGVSTWWEEVNLGGLCKCPAFTIPPPIHLGQEDCVTLYATSDTCNYFSTQVTFLHLLACTIFIVLQLHKHRTICVCCNIPPSVKHQEQCCVKCTWWLSCSWDCFVTPNRAWIHREAHETHWTQTNDEHFTLQHCQCWKYCLGVSYISQFMS